MKGGVDKMDSFAMGSYRFSVWLTRLAYLNLLWIAFTIIGLGIFGFMPATTAMFAIARKWLHGEVDIPITKTFWQQYKASFFQTNILGLILGGVGYLLVVEFRILQVQESMMYTIVGFGVLFILCMYGILLTYFFPIYVHFNLSLTEYLKWPLIIGIIHPLLSIFLLGLLGVGIYVLLMTVPAILFFFGGSTAAYIIMWGVSKTFEKYELREG